MKYLEWNDLIAKYFFNENNAQKEVLIYVNDDIINKIGASYNADVNDFIKAVKTGSPWATNGSFCQKAYKTFRYYKEKPDLRDYPLYIAYLAFFVLAATRRKEGANSNAYYARFEELAGEKKHPSFNLMEKLWHDLAIWCNQEKKESLGKFVVRARGNWCHVGLPWSQTLLTNEERKELKYIFYDAELDPADLPSSEAILQIILKYNKNRLENRTIKLIKGENSEERIALSLLVLNELEEWDESEIPPSIEGAPLEDKRAVRFKVCLRLDKVNRDLIAYFRIKTKRDFPQGTLRFKSLDGVYTCEYLCGNIDEGNWSTIIKDSNGSLNASIKTWNIDSLIFYDEVNKWKAKIEGKKSRLFIRGDNENLPDWIECEHLDRNKEFYVASFGEDIAIVEQWGPVSCESFEPVNFDGLPNGWRMFHGTNASLPCKGIHQLEISSLIKIKLIGPSIRRNTYLRSNPPNVLIENWSGKEELFLNGEEIVHEPKTDLWIIPPTDSLLDRARLEVKNHLGDTVCDRFVSFEEPQLPNEFCVPGRDKTGIVPLQRQGNIFGVIVKEKYFTSKMPTLYRGILARHGFTEAIIIGKNQGEIEYITNKDKFPQWKLFWAILKNGNYEIFNTNSLNLMQLFRATNLDKTSLKNFFKKIRKQEDYQLFREYWDILKELIEVEKNG